MSAPTPPRRILVLGGTGFVGRALCEALVERSGAGSGCLRVPTRRLKRGDAIRHLPTLELVQADVHDRTALEGLLHGMDAVVNLVAILHGSPADFERAHVTLPRTLAAAMQATGVQRLVHISALGVGPTAPSNYLRSKTEGEAVLQAAGLELTVLRPSVIFGAEDRFLNTFAALQAIAPVVPLAGADARFQPVWVNDVAHAISASLDQPATIGQTIECAGPQVYTLGELVQAAGRWSGRPRTVIPLPMAIGRLQTALMGLMPGEPLMTADNLDSMSVPNVATGALPGLAELGISPAALAAIGPGYLSQREGCARLDPLRQRAGR
jgi:uncharacterized protein YbjT (DUF2867 family)